MELHPHDIGGGCDCLRGFSTTKLAKNYIVLVLYFNVIITAYLRDTKHYERLKKKNVIEKVRRGAPCVEETKGRKEWKSCKEKKTLRKTDISTYPKVRALLDFLYIKKISSAIISLKNAPPDFIQTKLL